MLTQRLQVPIQLSGSGFHILMIYHPSFIQQVGSVYSSCSTTLTSMCAFTTASWVTTLDTLGATTTDTKTAKCCSVWKCFCVFYGHFFTYSDKRGRQLMFLSILQPHLISSDALQTKRSPRLYQPALAAPGPIMLTIMYDSPSRRNNATQQSQQPGDNKARPISDLTRAKKNSVTAHRTLPEHFCADSATLTWNVRLTMVQWMKWIQALFHLVQPSQCVCVGLCIHGSLLVRSRHLLSDPRSAEGDWLLQEGFSAMALINPGVFRSGGALAGTS